MNEEQELLQDQAEGIQYMSCEELTKRQADAVQWAQNVGMNENLRLRELGGAGPDENITAMTERLIRDLEAHRMYARALCKAVDAATDFASTVAGGASWWDDVWAEHVAALDRAREQITLAGGPNVRAKLPAEEADDRPRRDDGNARPERPGIGCRSGSA